MLLHHGINRETYFCFVTFHASNYRICEHQHLRRNLTMQRQRDASAVGQTCSSCTHAEAIIKSGYRQFDWYVMTDNDSGQQSTLVDDDSDWGLLDETRALIAKRHPGFHDESIRSDFL